MKYRPEHTPSSSGDRMSSDTADSSNTLGEMFWGVENSQTINQISRLNQIFNHVADFKRRCPTVEKGTNLMSVQSMTCCLQVTMSCTASAADVLCLTQSIDNAVAMVTAMIACYQFSETVCSQRPAGAHFPFPPLSTSKAPCNAEAPGTIFLC